MADVLRRHFINEVPEPPEITIVRTFDRAIQKMQSELERLIIEAEASRLHLDELETRLNTIYEIVTEEDMGTQIKKDEVVSPPLLAFSGRRRLITVPFLS